MNKRSKQKLKLQHETVANLELALVQGGLASTSSNDDTTTQITRPGMASCWSCFLTHCCRG